MKREYRKHQMERWSVGAMSFAWIALALLIVSSLQLVLPFLTQRST